jgi:xylose isomerase
MNPAFPDISKIPYEYDSDAAACLNFLREHGLLEHFKLHLETNHATLAGHTMHHECEVAAAAGALGTVDANTGDELIGWDTDQLPTSLYLTTQVMLTVLKIGGFTTGGLTATRRFGARALSRLTSSTPTSEEWMLSRAD